VQSEYSNDLVPEQGTWVYDAPVHKLCPEDVWMPRHLIATRATIFLASEEAEDVEALAQIPLREVSRIRNALRSVPVDEAAALALPLPPLRQEACTLQEGANMTLGIETRPDGLCAGRRFILRAASEEARDALETALVTLVGEALRREMPVPALVDRCRITALRLYNRKESRALVALLIFLSFVCDALEAQMLPQAADRQMLLDEQTLASRAKTFKALEIAFTCMFTVVCCCANTNCVDLFCTCPYVALMVCRSSFGICSQTGGDPSSQTAGVCSTPLSCLCR
jgi:hypothetical protein